MTEEQKQQLIHQSISYNSKYLKGLGMSDSTVAEIIQKIVLNCISKLDCEWVTICEGCKMPKLHKKVLVRLNYFGPTYINKTVTIVASYSGEEYYWSTTGYSINPHNMKVTHWRYLPQPPELTKDQK